MFEDAHRFRTAGGRVVLWSPRKGDWACSGCGAIEYADPRETAEDHAKSCTARIALPGI